jgi:hypothetical protein
MYLFFSTRGSSLILIFERRKLLCGTKNNFSIRKQEFPDRLVFFLLIFQKKKCFLYDFCAFVVSSSSYFHFALFLSYFLQKSNANLKFQSSIYFSIFKSQQINTLTRRISNLTSCRR